MRAGRPRQKENPPVVTISLLKAPEGLLEEIDKIAKRENKSRTEITLEAWQEYVPRHGLDPNSQQRMTDYYEGTSKTTAFLKSEILRELEDRREVSFKEILSKVDAKNINKSRRIEEANKIAKELHEKGVRIWR